MVDSDVIAKQHDAPLTHTKKPLLETQSEAVKRTTEELQFVTFHLDQEVFAFPMGSVREIIRIPNLAAVPLSPPSMEGLANLRGLLLPVVNLTQLLFSRAPVLTDAARVIVTDMNGAAVGFVVDRVDQVVRVLAGKVEKAAQLQATVECDRLAGVIKEVAGHPMILLLDIDRLIGIEFTNLIKQTKPIHGIKGGGNGQSQTTASGEHLEEMVQLVSFQTANQEYAVPIHHVREIVRVPNDISKVPNSAFHVLGIINLRNQLLPLVSLRRLFSLPEEALNDQSRIIVVALHADHSKGAVGIVTDHVREVLRLPVAQTEVVPEFFTKDRQIAEIESICRLEGGKRLVATLSVQRLFEHEALREALRVKQDQEGLAMADSVDDLGTSDREIQLVVFRLAGEEYGVAIESVQEIIRIPEELARIPQAPDFIEGIVNLRGLLLPVVDLRARLGMARMQRHDRQRIVVFTLGGVRTGFIVDSVSEVLKLETRFIEASPNFSAEQQRIMTHVANLREKKRMILILEVAKVMKESEIQMLAEVAA